MIKDPMVTVSKPDPAQATPGTSPVLPTRVAKTIVPQAEPVAPDEAEKPPEETPITEPSIDTAPEVEDRQVPQLVKAIQREKAAEAEAEAQKSESTDTEVQTAPDEAEEPPAALETESDESTDTIDSPLDEIPEATEPSGQPEAPGTNAEETSTDATTPENTDTANQSMDSDQDPTTLDEAAKQVTDGQKETQAQEHIQQLIDQKTYYLPIKVAKKRHTFVALLLLVGLAAAGYFYVTMMM